MLNPLKGSYAAAGVHKSKTMTEEEPSAKSVCVCVGGWQGIAGRNGKEGVAKMARVRVRRDKKHLK